MGEVKWNMAALGRVVGKSEASIAAVEEATERVYKSACSMSDGFRTGVYHDHETGERKGETPPEYMRDVKMLRNSCVGIVYTGNYAAIKDNHENNTLLKARG